jgi:hypothetical protein
MDFHGIGVWMLWISSDTDLIRAYRAFAISVTSCYPPVVVVVEMFFLHFCVFHGKGSSRRPHKYFYEQNDK